MRLTSWRATSRPETSLARPGSPAVAAHRVGGVVGADRLPQLLDAVADDPPALAAAALGLPAVPACHDLVSLAVVVPQLSQLPVLRHRFLSPRCAKAPAVTAGALLAAWGLPGGVTVGV